MHHDVMVHQCRGHVPNALPAQDANLPVPGEVLSVPQTVTASMGSAVEYDWALTQLKKRLLKLLGCRADHEVPVLIQPADVQDFQAPCSCVRMRGQVCKKRHASSPER